MLIGTEIIVIIILDVTLYGNFAIDEWLNWFIVIDFSVHEEVVIIGLDL